MDRIVKAVWMRRRTVQQQLRYNAAVLEELRRRGEGKCATLEVLARGAGVVAICEVRVLFEFPLLVRVL